MEGLNPTLEAFNLDTSGYSRLSHSLTDLHFGELQSIVETISNGAELPVHENERVNNMTLRYAIVEAFRNGRDAVTEDDLKQAQERALGTAEKLGTFRISVMAEEANPETPENASDEPKRRRNANNYPSVKRMVESSPDAEKDEIVERAVKELGVRENTAMQYFYKARRELGLKTGKKGKKASDLFPTMLDLVRQNRDSLDREQIVDMAVDKGIKKGTAVAYYYKAIKTLNEES